LINNRQNGRRRGRGGQQARNGQPGGPDRGSRLDNRARGNAAQLLEKYKTLARDAQMQGDRVNTEYYLQFADHYFRVLSENRARFEEQRPRQANDRDDFGGDEEGGDANQQRYQGNDDQGDSDGWYEDQPQSQPQPQAEQQREPRRERQSSPNENDGERGGGNREAPREGNRDRGRRNGNAGANANANGNNGGGNSYANGNGNGFAAPDFLSEPLAPRYERDAEDDDVQASGADAAPAQQAAPKPRRPRRPRSETAEV
jgi:hypothetical protein